MFDDVLQIPDSKPTLKQLESLLNDTERTEVGVDASKGGRTFILTMELTCSSEALVVYRQSSEFLA